MDTDQNGRQYGKVSRINTKAQNMNIKRLKEKLINVEWIGYGTYRVTVEHSRRINKWKNGSPCYWIHWKRSHITHNSQAVDRLSDSGHVNDRVIVAGYTYKQALMALVRP
jgi:hypothetical protein